MRSRLPARVGTGLRAVSYVLGVLLIGSAVAAPFVVALLVAPFVVWGVHLSDAMHWALVTWTLPAGVVGLVFLLLSGFGRTPRA